MNARNMAVLEVCAGAAGGTSLGRWLRVYSIERMVAHLVPSWFGEKYRLFHQRPWFCRWRPIDAAGAGREPEFSVPLDPPGNGLALARLTAYRGQRFAGKGFPGLR